MPEDHLFVAVASEAGIYKIQKLKLSGQILYSNTQIKPAAIAWNMISIDT